VALRTGLSQTTKTLLAPFESGQGLRVQRPGRAPPSPPAPAACLDAADSMRGPRATQNARRVRRDHSGRGCYCTRHAARIDWRSRVSHPFKARGRRPELAREAELLSCYTDAGPFEVTHGIDCFRRSPPSRLANEMRGGNRIRQCVHARAATLAGKRGGPAEWPPPSGRFCRLVIGAGIPRPCVETGTDVELLAARPTIRTMAQIRRRRSRGERGRLPAARRCRDRNFRIKETQSRPHPVKIPIPSSGKAAQELGGENGSRGDHHCSVCRGEVDRARR